MWHNQCVNLLSVKNINFEKFIRKMNKSMECQVVVVGDAKVGKSAMIRRLTQDKFSEVSCHVKY